MNLKGQHFERVSDIQRELQVVLDSIKETDIHGAFEAWKKWRDCWILSQRDHFERYGRQKLSKLSQNLFFDLFRELSDRPSYIQAEDNIEAF
jgi:exonuclease III